MWETSLEFLRPGLHSFIHDAGREGLQSQGIPRGGVMDSRSTIIGNRLVGNIDNNPIIEMALRGPKIKTMGDAYMAITGAEIKITINNKVVDMYETLHVPSGSTIDLGTINKGARSYLALNGEWKVDQWLESCSPIPIINLKNLQSNLLAKNSKLVINTQKMISKKRCPENLRHLDNQNTIRIIRGPEYDLMSSSNQSYLSDSEFTIHKNSNRMAVSTEEYIPNYQNEKELISSANLIGTIQLTNQGQLLILMNDGGTTGGYPRIANVISADIPKVAQLTAGQKINFQLVDIDFAINELKKEKELLNSI